MRLLLLLLLLSPVAVQAQFSYTTNNGAVTIEGYIPPGVVGAVVIPDTIVGLPVVKIADSVFANLASMTSITFPDTLTNIGNIVFDNCTGLTSVTIPDSVISLGYNAFSSCFNLTNITFGSNVTSIGDSAFRSCTSLTNVTLPASVTNLENQVFFLCPNLNAITVAASNPAYSSVNGILFNKDQTTVLQYPAGKNGSYTIPNTVTAIGYSAFGECHGLTGVTIPGSVTSIGGYAFVYCNNLAGITIPVSVTSIGTYAFTSCSSLTGIAVPASVTSLGNYAFYACNNLGGITVDALNPNYSSVDGVLFNKTQTKILQYPMGKAGSYTIPSSVTTIGISAFDFLNQLTSVTVPASVTNLENYVFANCFNLTSIYFQGNAPSLGFQNFSSPETLYYLPGTTGWSSSFGGRPAVLWNPQAQTGDASFGVQSNQFGFNLTGTSNLVIVVETCTNLTNPAWTPLQTNTLTGSAVYFSDSEWTNSAARFYRFRSP